MCAQVTEHHEDEITSEQQSPAQGASTSTLVVCACAGACACVYAGGGNTPWFRQWGTLSCRERCTLRGTTHTFSPAHENATFRHRSQAWSAHTKRELALASSNARARTSGNTREFYSWHKRRTKHRQMLMYERSEPQTCGSIRARSCSTACSGAVRHHSRVCVF